MRLAFTKVSVRYPRKAHLGDILIAISDSAFHILIVPSVTLLLVSIAKICMMAKYKYDVDLKDREALHYY